MNQRIKTSLLISVILANLMFANFALGQTVPPLPSTPLPQDTTTKILDQTALAAAQNSIDTCKTFKDLVWNVSNQQAAAIWDPTFTKSVNGVPTNGGCFIVPGTYHVEADKITGSFSSIPAEYVQIQTQIANGKGITAQQWTDSQTQTNNEVAQANWLSRMVGYVLTWFFDLLTAFALMIASLAGGIFSYFLNNAVSVTSMPTFVNFGWTIVRDFCNMFFILILIAIALATILRIESYDYKKLLKDVIIMALLVNFSKVIAETLINFTNFIMASFAGDIGLRFVAKSMWTFIDAGGSSIPYGGASAGLALGIGKLVFAYASAIAFLALAGLFVVRQVGLYVLVILSPIAYVMNILPITKNYASEWWQNFIKYLIWGPVALFFIKLTFLMINNHDLLGNGTASGESAFVFIILAAFMFASVMVAQKAGMIGGEAVVNGVKNGVGWAGHRALGFAGKGWNNLTTRLLETHDGSPVRTWRKALFAVANPVATLRGYEQRAEETKHMAKELSTAGGREIAEQVLTGGWRGIYGRAKPQLKIPYMQFEERREEDAFLKDYGNMKKESLMRAAVTTEKMGGPEGDARRRAIIKAAASGGYLDDLLRMKQFANKYADKDGTTYSAEVLNRFLYGYLGSNEQAQRFMAEDMEELGKKVKHFEYLGHAFYNPQTQRFERGMKKKAGVAGTQTFKRGGKDVTIDIMAQGTDRSDPATFNHQASYAAGEFGKLGGRDRVSIAPHNITVIRSNITAGTNDFANPNEELGEDKYYRENGELDVSSKQILSKLDSDVAREAQHAQERVKNRVLSEKFDKGTKEVVVTSTEEHQKIEKLYRANQEYVVGMYCKAQGIDPRSYLESVAKAPPGTPLASNGLDIKVRLEDPLTGAVIARSTIH